MIFYRWILNVKRKIVTIMIYVINSGAITPYRGGAERSSGQTLLLWRGEHGHGRNCGHYCEEGLKILFSGGPTLFPAAPALFRQPKPTCTSLFCAFVYVNVVFIFFFLPFYLPHVGDFDSHFYGNILLLPTTLFICWLWVMLFLSSISFAYSINCFFLNRWLLVITFVFTILKILLNIYLLLFYNY